LSTDAEKQLNVKLTRFDLNPSVLEFMSIRRLEQLSALLVKLVAILPEGEDLRMRTAELLRVQEAVAEKSKGLVRRSRHQRRLEADELLNQEKVFRGVSKGLGYAKGRGAVGTPRAKIVPGGRADGNKK